MCAQGRAAERATRATRPEPRTGRADGKRPRVVLPDVAAVEHGAPAACLRLRARAISAGVRDLLLGVVHRDCLGA
jgi:hypothetical protein